MLKNLSGFIFATLLFFTATSYAEEPGWEMIHFSDNYVVLGYKSDEKSNIRLTYKMKREKNGYGFFDIEYTSSLCTKPVYRGQTKGTIDGKAVFFKVSCKQLTPDLFNVSIDYPYTKSKTMFEVMLSEEVQEFTFESDDLLAKDSDYDQPLPLTFTATNRQFKTQYDLALTLINGE